MSENQTRESVILGQKYAFATVSLILGIFSFVNLLGLEKPILAIIFGWLALRAKPEPRLTEHRVWAKAGVVLEVAGFSRYWCPWAEATAVGRHLPHEISPRAPPGC